MRDNGRSFQELVEAIDSKTVDAVNVDFDLILTEEQLQQPLPASGKAPAARVRPGIVTAIQEDGLASVIATERVCSGTAIGIRDQWRCDDPVCSNIRMFASIVRYLASFLGLRTTCRSRPISSTYGLKMLS